MGISASSADLPRERPQIAALVATGSLAAGVVFAGAGFSDPSLALVAITAVVLGVVVLANPELGVPVAVFLLWTNTPVVATNSHNAPALIALVVPGLLALPLISRFRRGEGDLVVSTGLAWMLLMALVIVISTLGAAAGSMPVSIVVKFALEGIVVYALILNVVRTPGVLRDAMWAIVAACAFLALISSFQALSGATDRPFFGFAGLDHAFFQGKGDVPRSFGPVDDPNYYAQLLLPGIAIAMLFMWRERTRFLRMTAAGATVLIGLGVVFTYSRGAALALAMMFLLFAALGYVRTRGFVMVAVLLVVTFIAIPAYGQRIASLAGIGGATAEVGQNDAADESAQSRATENKAALLVFYDHPVIGVGPGEFPSHYQEYAMRVGGAIHQASKRNQQGTAAGEAPKREAHNIVLNIAAEQGFVGLVVFAGFMLFTFFGLLRVRRRWRRTRPDLEGLASGLIVAIFGYLVSGLFLTLAFERYFWLLAALGGAAILILSRPDPDVPSFVTPPRSGARRSAARPRGSKVVPLPLPARSAPALEPAQSSVRSSRGA